MMQKRYVIFDLDQTLVDSSALANERDKKDWDAVYRGVSKVQIYPGVLDLLKAVRDAGYKIAVVTSSPKRYCDEVCKRLGIISDVSVCYDDVARPKPQPDSFRLALALLKGYSGDSKDQVKVTKFLSDRYYKYGEALYPQTIVVGDSYRDVLAASNGTMVPFDVVGVTWGIPSADELISSHPTYIANSVSDLKHLLIRHHDEYGPLRPQRDEADFAHFSGLWKSVRNGDDGDLRHNLRPGAPFLFARRRWEGGWQVSYGNHLVSNFKVEHWKNPNQEWAKNRAVEKFATELKYALPPRAQVVFIRSSKAVGDPEYDDRFERLERALLKIRPDVVVSWPISLTVSGAAAHKSKDKKLRDPDEIVKALQWNGKLEPGEAVYVVDDVLTSGGHLEAYIRMIEVHAPGVKVFGLFWTLHMGNL
jgi:phosphoglycolate phosphatase-like HAD superfamily hydrolase